MSSDKRLLCLSEQDNVLICCRAIAAGETVTIDDKTIVASSAIDVGHKLARRPIAPGEKILRNNMPIGSATRKIEPGQHVHIHNMQSDYIASHGRSAVEGRI